MQYMFFKAWFPLWFNMKERDIIFVRILLTQVDPNGKRLSKNYPPYFAKFISRDNMILKSKFFDYKIMK